MDRDWMPTTQSIKRVSGRSQEREFSMQRQGDKISDFGTYSTAETAQTKKPGTHVFDISAVSRVSLSHHNYREWVVETRWIETGCPPLSLSNESPVGARNGNFRCRDRQNQRFCHVFPAETARIKKTGTHVIDTSDVLRVSLSHHNHTGIFSTLKPNGYFQSCPHPKPKRKTEAPCPMLFHRFALMRLLARSECFASPQIMPRTSPSKTQSSAWPWLEKNSTAAMRSTSGS